MLFNIMYFCLGNFLELLDFLIVCIFLVCFVLSNHWNYLTVTGFLTDFYQTPQYAFAS